MLIGSGGHAQVLLETLLAHRTDVTVYGILDPNIERQGERIFGVSIIGDDSWLSTARDHGVTHFVVGAGSIGDSSLRERLYKLGLSHSLIPLSVIHPGAYISPRAIPGLGVQIMANAIINTNAQIGNNVIINTGSIVEHDCIIGDHVHIASGACLTGQVHVGQGTHIGAGATIRQSIKIGDYVIIGLGAGVVKDV
ncbi:MAG: acetyltransferase, partial [Aggregatilineales bacterium]